MLLFAPHEVAAHCHPGFRQVHLLLKAGLIPKQKTSLILLLSLTLVVLQLVSKIRMFNS